MVGRTGIWVLSGVLIAATLVSTSATAGPYAAGADRLRVALRACGGDIAVLCGQVVPGGGRIAQCLADHRAQLSPACRATSDRALAVRRAFLACNAAAQRLCGDVRPGGGRIVRCLSARRTALSSACRNALEDAQATLDP